MLKNQKVAAKTQ